MTEENVAYAFKNRVLIKGLHMGMSELLNIPGDLLDDPLGAASWWIRQGKDRRWRVIVYYLDNVEETGLADELMPFSEPPPGERGTAGNGWVFLVTYSVI